MFDDRLDDDPSASHDGPDKLDGWTPGDQHRQPERVGPAGLSASLRELMRDRLPIGLRGARLDIGGRAAVALALLALVAAAVALALAWRSSSRPVAAVTSAAGRPIAVPAPSPDAGSVPVVSPAGRGPSAVATGASGSVVVEVTGKVRRPGVVTVTAGARVTDAIRAAGGLLPGTNTEGLSLARRLVDGEQLLVGMPPPSLPVQPATGSTASAGAVAGQPVDLNAATVADLDALPGIGPVLAQRMIDWRDAHGGFSSVDQLREVSGVGDKKFEALADLVRV